LTHNALFPHDCIHVENLGGDIGLKELHNKRITLGVTFMLGGCCAGVSVIFAQLYGGGDYEKFRREGFLAAAFGGVFTILVSAAAILLLKPLLDILQTPANVAAYAQEYLVIVICGFIATFLYSLCAAALRAMGSTRTALLILAFAMFLNLILDLVLVAVLRLGVAGAAWATVIRSSCLPLSAACI
jgi:Na+-driven multidrug efflux pump